MIQSYLIEFSDREKDSPKVNTNLKANLDQSLATGKCYKRCLLFMHSVVWLARGILVTSILLAAAWVLMLTYQVFTKTALTSVASSLNGVVPYLASTLSSNIGLAVFICSFAWMFVLSTVISNLIFGNQRRVFVQFLIGLMLTLTASALFDAAKWFGWDLSNPKTLLANRYAQVFNSAVFSALFLSLPFVFMIGMDLRAMMKARK